MKFILLLLVGVVFFGCKNSSNEDNKKLNLLSVALTSNTINKVDSDSVYSSQEMEFTPKDTINNDPDKTIEFNSIDDYIIKYPKGYEADLRANIKHKIEAWKSVDNPFVATYKGNEFGDYHHIEFEGSNGVIYDFGFGNNDYGNIELYFDDEQLTDNPKYLDKTFKIYWGWKISSFPCCSGEFLAAEAYLPSIVKLELIEN